MLNSGIEEQWDIPHRVLFPSGLLKASGPVWSLCLDSSVYFWQALTTSAFVQLATNNTEVPVQKSCMQFFFLWKFMLKQWIHK